MFVNLRNEVGWLGVKGLEIFNYSLLPKWRWRCLTDRNTIWRELLEHRYIDLVNLFTCRDEVNRGTKDSIWWRDLISLCLGSLDVDDVFRARTSSVLGSGKNLLFWKHRWIGVGSLQAVFLDLYNVAVHKNTLVADIRRFTNGVLRWLW